MLVLFDIDGTLLSTDGAGVRAMGRACRTLYGRALAFDEVEIAGRLDPIIWAQLMRANGESIADGHHDRFRAAYARELDAGLAGDERSRLMPGVEPLLDALERLGAVLGLLTGNYPETGRLKVRHAGLDPDRFPICAWGSDGEDRRDLPPVALRRFVERYGRAVPAEATMIIGDTPHDVACARANGCRCLAVATGSFSAGDLQAAGADRVVDDLTATESLCAWIGERLSIAPAEEPR